MSRFFVFQCSLIWLLHASLAVASGSILVAGSEFNLSWRGSFSISEQDKLKLWLQHAGETAAGLYGELPRNPIRIVVQRSTGSGGPVPFGQVIRRDLQGVRFYVNPQYPLESFTADWTAVHELVHLFIPYPGEEDIWLSEGLATYYQNVLQARAGVISERRAWQKLYEGFGRGERDDGYGHLSLQALSPRMRETGSFMRVYWSGTAFFLEADVLLRERVGGGWSLDRVVQGFVGCCLERRYIRDGLGLMSAFDGVVGEAVFVPLYLRYRELFAQPDMGPLLGRLGVSVVGGRVRLVDGGGSGVRLRRELTRGLGSSLSGFGGYNQNKVE
nr:hypothetical protein [Pseudomaricurvus alkylphenolicus]